MSYHNKYLKYKSKYLKLKNNQKGKGKSWIKQQAEIKSLLKEKVFSLLWEKNPEKNTDLLSWLTQHKKIKNAQEIIKNKLQFKQLIESLKEQDLMMLDRSEHFNLVQMNTLPNLNIKEINQYINDANLELSYSINNQGNISEYHENDIRAMYSIGKVFTGMLVILLVDDGTIDEKSLHKTIQLDKNVLNKLSSQVKARLNETTFLDVMTHSSGLKDDLPKYFAAIEKAIVNKTSIPNPIEPEDFVVYADEDLANHKHSYSNLGILLVGLSIKYHYNKKHNSTLTYNEILNKYIVDKIGLKTFSITRPNNAKYNEDITKYKNGAPDGGYYISCNELRMFGEWVNKLYNENKNINELVKKYGTEFYRDNMVEHGGSISPNLDKEKLTSTSQLSIYLNDNIVISIMSNHKDDSWNLSFAMILYK